ncbi:MAG: hypothetical protein ACQCN3_04420 [Candidatus Bathyarchaeia archaeon]|jgi:hypothetical protein
MSATIFAVIVAGLVLTTLTTALLTSTSSLKIPTDGVVTTPAPTPTPTVSLPPVIPPPPTEETVEIAVYSDEACTNKYSSITWNAVMPGHSTTKTVYVKNIGTEQVTLHLETSNLSPAEALGKIDVTWNKEGQTLAAGEKVSAILTLSVDSSISGVTNFNIDITIEGSAS